MTQDTLPLRDLFNRLRDHGLPLGIDEYTAILNALEAGIGLSDRNAVKQLCITLWIKSREELLLFNRLFELIMSQPILSTEDKKVEATLLKSDGMDAKTRSALEKHLSPEGRRQVDRLSQDASLEIKEPSQIVQAIRHGGNFNLDNGRPKYSLLSDYFPVTSRQMKQSWRYLRRSVREGPPVEFDINSTIEKISREGFFSGPVLSPRRSNRAEIILLIDQDGSMVPFHALSKQLIDTVKRGGRLHQTNVYYFHDYPTEYLYIDSTRLTAKQTTDVLMNLNTYAAVLIVSDAGAARGNLDRERIKQTQSFIYKLEQHVRRFAWLNPLPDSRWPNTTAEAIAYFVPMFDMSRWGIDNAVNVLRGRYIYWEKLYSWMI